jgi:hypothetical protein
MGCAASSADGPDANRRKVRPMLSLPEVVQPTRPPNPLIPACANMAEGVTRVPHNSESLPVVALTPNAAAFAAAPIMHPDGNPVGVSLPTVVLSLDERRRILVVAHIQMLAACTSTKPEFSAFLESSSRFCGSLSFPNFMACILDCPPGVGEAIQANLSAFDVDSEIQTFVSGMNLARYSLIVTTTDFSNPGVLEEHSRKGGTLIIGVVRPANGVVPLRGFLMTHGIGVLSGGWSIGEPSQISSRVLTGEEFEQLTMPGLTEQFVEMVADPTKVVPEVLDHVVATLRYHVMTLALGVNPFLTAIFQSGWEFLDKTNAYSKEAICPEVVHGVVAVLLSEVMSKLVPREFEGINRSVPFPGECGPCDDLGEFKLELVFQCDGWYSTGLYLPPGRVATVESGSVMQCAGLQVGAHTQGIFLIPPPWKRWALSANFFPFIPTGMEIGSPFGGIIYVIQDGLPVDLPLSRISLTVSGVFRHPFFCETDPDAWEATRSSPAPWGEIETEFVVFTAPTSQIMRLRDIRGFVSFINHIMKHLLSFTSDECPVLYRIVFDVEVVTPPSSDSYPIFLSMTIADELFRDMAPSVALFEVLESVAQRSLPTVGFPIDSRLALAKLAACATFEAFWADEPVEKFVIGEQDSLFQTMLALYHHHAPDLFPSALKHVRGKITCAAPAPDFFYTMFVDRVYARGQVRDSTAAIGAVEPDSDDESVASTLVEFEITAKTDMVYE